MGRRIRREVFGLSTLRQTNRTQAQGFAAAQGRVSRTDRPSNVQKTRTPPSVTPGLIPTLAVRYSRLPPPRQRQEKTCETTILTSGSVIALRPRDPAKHRPHDFNALRADTLPASWHRAPGPCAWPLEQAPSTPPSSGTLPFVSRHATSDSMLAGRK